MSDVKNTLDDFIRYAEKTNRFHDVGSYKRIKAHISDLESRLAIYERAAEIFGEFSLHKVNDSSGTWFCYAGNSKGDYSGEGETPEEALSNALKEVDDVD